MTATAPIVPAFAAQIAASDPDSNVWLVANAGSGKTRVLTDRVARLLVRGVDPQNILCLTYTKAAAAEMQNRLFRRLGDWAMAPEPALSANLRDLGEGTVLGPDQLRRARQLFARAIEAPGGLRIQTIHSFCGGLLRRFPLEAGVSPSFQELDDRSATLLRTEVLEAMAEDADAGLFQAVLADSGESIESLLKAIVSQAGDFAVPPPAETLRAAFGLRAGDSTDRLLADVWLGGEAELLKALIAALAAGGTNDTKAAARLSGQPSLQPSLAALEVLEDVMLFGAGAAAPFAAKTASFPTKPTRARLTPFLPALDALMGRVEVARPRRLALQAADSAGRLARFAAAFLARYDAAKTARAVLDFDDLIRRASALLTDPAVAPWVLYRLDGSIDHVLVDEAQDTSPAQWQIVAALTAEFTAGDGARHLPRSLFVVGDKKQSIYSFQGADVAGFDAVKTRFAGSFAGAGVPMVERPLIHSFRSSGAILSLVDRCFQTGSEAAMGGGVTHQPFHEMLPGRVDLWPPVPKPEKPEPGAWDDPVDLPGEDDADVVLARSLADEISRLIANGAQVPGDPKTGGFRALHPGDVLILVRRRRQLFHEIIRACKAAGLPIAGADRLKLLDELAVRDILALLSFVNTPEDDLSLAVALRSPLFGWSESRLYRLAQGRRGYLWERMRHDPEAVDTVAVLQDLRDRAEFLRPFELISRVLTRHGGRARLLGRLGDESADAIDELLTQALTYERSDVPGLTGFLGWMLAGNVEAKRQADGEGRQIRVMTVHGAKGLEAPLVILADTADRQARDDDPLVTLAPGIVAWSGRKDDSPPAVQVARARRRDDAEAESLRLLYVAMTRARTWLLVAAAGDASDDSWYGRIRAAAASMPMVALGQGRMRHETGLWPQDQAARPLPMHARPDAPDLPEGPLLPVPASAQVLSPSALGGSKVVPGEADSPETEDARLRGDLLHLLLEHLPGLPAGARPALALQLGADSSLLAEAAALVDDPALATLFGPDTLAEADVAAPWLGHVLTGKIDRLVLTPDTVLAVDFKSNRVVPASPGQTPEGYLRQMGAYAHVLGHIYPERRILTAILWTRGRVLLPLDPEIVRQALLRAAIP